MNQQQVLSDVAKSYLCRYYEILDEMIAGMTDVKPSDSLSCYFIQQMIPHHMGAIEMSHNILQYTTWIPLQNIALNIIDEQCRSIENMREIFSCCCEFSNSRQDLCLYERNYRQISAAMFSQMQNACSANNINADFMLEMIPHHEGAIRMSQSLLRFAVCPHLVPVLEAIIQSQQKGVRQMERLLRCLPAV